MVAELGDVPGVCPPSHPAKQCHSLPTRSQRFLCEKPDPVSARNITFLIQVEQVLTMFMLVQRLSCMMVMSSTNAAVETGRARAFKRTSGPVWFYCTRAAGDSDVSAFATSQADKLVCLTTKRLCTHSLGYIARHGPLCIGLEPPLALPSLSASYRNGIGRT